MSHLLILAVGLALGVAAQRRQYRHVAAEHEMAAAMTDHFRDAADKLAVELDDVKAEASQAIGHLRACLVDQAVIVRKALGRPQKRTIPGGAA